MPTCLLGVVVRELETLIRGVGVEVVELDTETTEERETLLSVALELAEVDEDSMAFASAMETFAFPLAKLVTQTLI